MFHHFANYAGEVLNKLDRVGNHFKFDTYSQLGWSWSKCVMSHFYSKYNSLIIACPGFHKMAPPCSLHHTLLKNLSDVSTIMTFKLEST